MGYTTTDWINIDISMAQVKVLLILHHMGGHTINRLAERLQISAPTASQLVERLVKAGYASRRESNTDRRLVEVQLTERGQALVKNLQGPRDRVVAEWLIQLPVEHRLALGESLKALLAIIPNTAESAGNDLK